LAKHNVTPIAALSTMTARDASPLIKLAGVVVGRQERRSARGNRFAFIELSDPSGSIEVALFSETLAACQELLDANVPLLISVSVQIEGGVPRVTARSVQGLDDAVSGTAANLEVHLTECSSLDRLRTALDDAGKGRGRVHLVIEADGREIEIELPDGYAISPAVCMEIGEFPGVVGVEQV
jgi:DNA polymerase-3 subunit alpha